MSDNAVIKSDASATLFRAASHEVSFSGDTAQLQIIQPAHVAGSEGSKTVTELTDATGILTHPQPATSGGCSTYHIVSTGSTNVANVKASAGQVYGIDVFNNAAYPVYVKFHNTAGTPTAGASVVRTVGVQAGASVSLAFPTGLAFGTGIGVSIVQDITDAGTTAVLLSDCVVDVAYK